MKDKNKRTIATILAISMLLNSYNFNKSKEITMMSNKLNIERQDKCIRRLKKK